MSPKSGKAGQLLQRKTTLRCWEIRRSWTTQLIAANGWVDLRRWRRLRRSRYARVRFAGIVRSFKTLSTATRPRQDLSLCNQKRFDWTDSRQMS